MLRFLNSPRLLPLPQTKPRNPAACNAGRLAHARFRLAPLRSPLLGGSRLISLPLGTEMFQFPRFASRRIPLRSQEHCNRAVGFPIRTSADLGMVSSSPRLIAATHVLLRLRAPRHPPHALSSLTAYTPLLELSTGVEFVKNPRICYGLRLRVSASSLRPEQARRRTRLRLRLFGDPAPCIHSGFAAPRYDSPLLPELLGRNQGHRNNRIHLSMNTWS